MTRALIIVSLALFFFVPSTLHAASPVRWELDMKTAKAFMDHANSKYKDKIFAITCRRPIVSPKVAAALGFNYSDDCLVVSESRGRPWCGEVQLDAEHLVVGISEDTCASVSKFLKALPPHQVYGRVVYKSPAGESTFRA